MNVISKGAEAKKVYEEANKLINKFISNKSLVANAVFSFHKCNSNSRDDILIYDENNVHVDTLHGLRQQVVFEINYMFKKCFTKKLNFKRPLKKQVIQYFIVSLILSLQWKRIKPTTLDALPLQYLESKSCAKNLRNHLTTTSKLIGHKESEFISRTFIYRSLFLFKHHNDKSNCRQVG